MGGSAAADVIIRDDTMDRVDKRHAVKRRIGDKKEVVLQTPDTEHFGSGVVDALDW